jgi:hypothetical protein
LRGSRVTNHWKCLKSRARSKLGDWADRSDQFDARKIQTQIRGLDHQIPESFEGGEKDTLTAKLVSGLTTTEGPAVLKDRIVEVLNEEPIEIKAK